MRWILTAICMAWNAWASAATLTTKSGTLATAVSVGGYSANVVCTAQANLTAMWITASSAGGVTGVTITPQRIIEGSNVCGATTAGPIYLGESGTPTNTLQLAMPGAVPSVSSVKVSNPYGCYCVFIAITTGTIDAITYHLALQ